MPSRTLPIPDGIGGVRVDAALEKMLIFSRTFAAEVADAGGALNTPFTPEVAIRRRV